MSIERYYNDALENMERTVHGLASCVPQPQRIPYKQSFVFRYVEKTVEQAIVQKLARIVSTLKAAYLLMAHGLVQEQAALQRVLHEMHEDVILLCYARIFDDFTPLHQDFLDAFFEEEFDAETAMDSTQKRPMIPRRKIQAQIARIEVSGLDPSTGVELARTITKAYSGYITRHCRSLWICTAVVPRIFMSQECSARKGMRNTVKTFGTTFTGASSALDWQRRRSETTSYPIKFTRLRSVLKRQQARTTHQRLDPSET